MDSLKYALNSAVRKKEELYKVLVDYKHALEKANQRIQALEYNLSQVESVKMEIENVKTQLLKRDNKIKSLHNRNRTLESLLEQHESQTLQQSSSNLKPSPSYTSANLDLALDFLIQKVKSNTLYSRIFKSCMLNLSQYMDLSHLPIDEICIKLSKFSCELMKELEKHTVRSISPNFTDPHQSINSIYSTGNYMSFAVSNEDDYFLGNDEERFEKLNLELKSVFAKSKEVLSNRSFSMGVKGGSRNIVNFSPLPTSEVQGELASFAKTIDVTKDSLKEIPEARTRSVKGLARKVPRVEIIGKSSRSAKVIPKPSILRKK